MCMFCGLMPLLFPQMSEAGIQEPRQDAGLRYLLTQGTTVRPVKVLLCYKVDLGGQSFTLFTLDSDINFTALYHCRSSSLIRARCRSEFIFGEH